MTLEEAIKSIDRLMNISQRWLTVQEACRYAKMSRTTLMECVNSGDIKGSRRRGKWIVDRLSIDTYYQDTEFENRYRDVARRAGL